MKNWSATLHTSPGGTLLSLSPLCTGQRVALADTSPLAFTRPAAMRDSSLDGSVGRDVGREVNPPEFGGICASKAELQLNRLGEPAARHAALSCDVRDRKSTRLNSSHLVISYAVFCLKK